MHHRRVLSRSIAAATGLGLLVAMISPAAASAAGPAALANPGFESGLTGWTVSGTASAAKIEADGHDSAHRLTHYLAGPGSVTTSQKVRLPATGWFTYTASVKSGGPVGSSTLRVSGCAIGATTTVPSTEADDSWLTLAVSFRALTRNCTIGIRTTGATAWASIDSVAVNPGRTEREIRGADLSSIPRNEDKGAEYLTPGRRAIDPVSAFALAGANVGRLKVWVDPADGYNDLDDVVAMGKRITRSGMTVLVDFHYSDRWTDPGAQGVPAAWADDTVAEMTAHLREHTVQVLTALKKAKVSVGFVQVGNEINPGMLWPYGQTWDVVPGDGVDTAQWDSLAGFLTAGSTAVKQVLPQAKVILHLTNINNGIGSLTWWFDEITARDVPFDVIGLSYYSYWHGSFADLQEAVSVLGDRYDKDVIVVETAYPFTLADDPESPWENTIDLPAELTAGYPATPAGQAANFRAVQDVTVAAPGGRGLGAIYWEPAWTSVAGAGWDPADPTSGNAWENQAMFDYDGRMLVPAFSQFLPDFGTVPPGWARLLRR